MDPRNDEQTELLRNIWNEMKALGQHLGSRIDQTNERLDQTNARLETLTTRVDGLSDRVDQTNERLGKVEHTLQELATQQLFLTKFVKNAVDVEIADLKARVTRLEAKG